VYIPHKLLNDDLSGPKHVGGFIKNVNSCDCNPLILCDLFYVIFIKTKFLENGTNKSTKTSNSMKNMP
jgi:hypothetical protein